MAKKAIVDAVTARLASNWTQTAILSRNTNMQPPVDGSSYIRVDFPVTEDRHTALKGSYREDGSFRIVVATAIGGGLSESAALCESIATIFRGQKFDGVQCWAPSIREGIDDGSYFIAAVIVPYYFAYPG